MDLVSYTAPYELPWWVQNNVPSEYLDSTWLEGINPLWQEPSIVESIFSDLRKNYPYLHNMLVDKGIQVGLPSKERFMRMYEKSGVVPDMTIGGQDATRESNTLGIFDPATLMMLLTLDPNYKNLARHESGHAGIANSPIWQDIFDKMSLTNKQEAYIDSSGYPIESQIKSFNPESIPLLDVLSPSWRRDAKEEVILRNLFPVSSADKELPLTSPQNYISKRFNEYLRYGPMEK